MNKHDIESHNNSEWEPMNDEQLDDRLSGLVNIHDPDESNEEPHTYLGEIGGDTYYLYKIPDDWVVGVYEKASIDAPQNTDVVHIDNVEYHDGPHVDREYVSTDLKKIYLPSVDDFDDAVKHIKVNWEVYVREYRQHTKS